MELQPILNWIKKIIPEEEIFEKDKHFILPTICHNEDYKDASHKLYLYKNHDTDTPLFHCFTECGDTFNVYQLVQRYYSLREENISYREAMKVIHGDNFKITPIIKERPLIYHSEFKNPLSLELPEYSKNSLEAFGLDWFHPWALEGIDIDVLKKYNIKYSKSYEGVIIPHLDWRGRLIGIRIRNYNPEKEKMYKYIPLKMGEIFYRHPLSLNFFGIFQNQTHIKKRKRVYIFEAEKSVCQTETMFRENLSLAICGTNLSPWQVDMLIYFLGIEEVVIAFDKEYNNFTECFNYIQKIDSKVQYLKLFAKVGILIDEENKFPYKSSPSDLTKDDFHAMKIKWLE